MNIGFDAKRYFHNPTGLGNYSRTLVNGLAELYPEHHYFLFHPKPANQFAMPANLPLQEVLPEGWWSKKFSSYWRSKGVVDVLKKKNIDLYHGLSHEIPVGLKATGIRSVVTVHDLIFERYPTQYGRYEVLVHRRKIQYACRHADAVIAISAQTAQDLEQLYKVPRNKIAVCYQSCDPIFSIPAAANRIEEVRNNYYLPAHYFLYVGSIIERKNLLRICMAIKQAGKSLQLPLVVVGRGKKYAAAVRKYIGDNGLTEQVIFTADVEVKNKAFDLQNTENLAALYQGATGFIYPSLFEGFGIPVLEALWSGVPVITSNTSCLPETAGDAAIYIDPLDVTAMANALVTIQDNKLPRAELIEKGYQQAQKFTLSKCASQVMAVYKQIMQNGSL